MKMFSISVEGRDWVMRRAVLLTLIAVGWLGGTSGLLAQSSAPRPALEAPEVTIDAPPVTSPPESFFQMVSHRIAGEERAGGRSRRRPAEASPEKASTSDEAVDLRVREELGVYRKFYRKYLDVHGMPIVAHAKVADLALQRTYQIVTGMLTGRPDILAAMVTNQVYLIIIGKEQVYTDMPEYRNHPNPEFQNERVRGTGGNPTSFGEENLLSLPIDRYDDESIAVHEFCHTIDDMLERIDPGWTERLNSAYRNATEKKLFYQTYAGSNPAEYWAEIAQAYFDCNRANNWNHGPVGNRAVLRAHDPVGFELCQAVFKLAPEKDWRYTWLQKLPMVSAPPKTEKFKDIDPWYTKFTWAREFTVLGRGASDDALLHANETIRRLFAYRHDILKELINKGVRLVVLGPGEELADLPEWKHAAEKPAVNGTSRQLTYCTDFKLLVVAQEQVLGDATIGVSTGNPVILVLADAGYKVAGLRPAIPNYRGSQQYELRVKRLDVEFDQAVTALFEQAKAAGKWLGTPAAQDKFAYWSGGVLAYFDAAGSDRTPKDGQSAVHNRERLAEYDPGLFALVQETMAYQNKVDWRYQPWRSGHSPRAVNDRSDNLQQGRRGRGSERFGLRGIYRAEVRPHWFADNTKFWYRNDLADGAREFIVVDAERGTRERAFDHGAVAGQMGGGAEAAKLPVDELKFSPDGTKVTLLGPVQKWDVDLKTGTLTGGEPIGTATTGPRPESRERALGGTRPRPEAGNRSPDGKWTGVLKEHNLFLRDEAGQETQLSTDGREDNGYRSLEWSPDSTTVIAWKVEPGERKEVYLIRSSPKAGGRAELESRPYPLPGDKFSKFEPNLFEVGSRKQVKPKVDRFEHEWLTPRLSWSRDGSRFRYQQVDRGHQRLRVIEVEVHSGATRCLIDEQSDTFIWTAHTENLRLELVNWLEKTDDLIYVSEQDGWRHLYLVTAAEAKLRQITKGEWVVRGIEHIDEDARQIWFSAGGRNSGQDPYFLHHYRVNFDGSGLVALTDGDGSHGIQLSPDRKYLVDTYSRADAAPVSELRRASDGKLICKLEEADITELTGKGWKPPEVFVAKGRDGRTDIWGLIYRPPESDSSKSYPVIEDIYAGPQDSFVPKSFGGSRYQSLTALGFIVVKIDGMGTANRSKAFHDVCWKNLKDGGFTDRILWMRAAAAKRPEMDLSRVGVYGNSAGGQNAAAAVLFHPDFYKVSVASCGCHDNRMDKASWNEQWMGYLPPDKIWRKEPGNPYSACSNIDNAWRLQGKLFLVVGELDDNVPPESTTRFVDALIKAGKDFDLLIVPGGGHGMGGAYGQRRMEDFFVRHLLGTEPPNRNVPAGPAAGL